MKEKNYYQNNQKKLVAKDEFLKDLKKGLKEIKEIQKGKKKKNTMQDFNDYVQSK